MQFHKITISVTLAIAATAGQQSATCASTKYDFITKQVELQTVQPQITQPKQQIKSISVNQAGQTFFSHPPRLNRAAAFPNQGYVPSTYEFTLTVPQDAGQPLQAVKITQSESPETIKFNVNNSKAFLGDRVTASSEIRLASTGGEQSSNPGEVTIVFDQPVQPGNTVTVALAAQRNPLWGGVYLFGVTAYPTGDNGLGQFLGYGRINFYGNSN